jgi:2-dehydro-3-deoxyphosphogluconate aldolase / (4S)-4-hydroxy-2-oxoglutarate aldolase
MNRQPTMTEATRDIRQQIVQEIEDGKVVAVIRMTDSSKLIRVVEAIREGGVRAIEITMTVPGALDLIREVSTQMGDDVLVGVGSVVTPEMARDAVEAGARYVVSPVFLEEVVEAAHEAGVPSMPGAFTPTEALKAYRAGADMVKIFPADVLGIPFFKGVLAPMPFLKLMPTGGVTVENVGQWLAAGARAVGIGSALLDGQAIKEERYEVLTQNARKLMENAG